MARAYIVVVFLRRQKYTQDYLKLKYLFQGRKMRADIGMFEHTVLSDKKLFVYRESAKS
jgi:hypothetical protein